MGATAPVRARLCAVVLTVVFMVVAGCGRPAGTDGDLADDWSPMPTATLAVPVAGECYDFLGFTASVQSAVVGNRVRCPSKRIHQESVHVGTFSGSDAQAPSAPGEGSRARRAAYEQCQPAVTEYLGGDWHTATVWFTLVLPTEAAWRAGARWFRCDLAELYTPFSRIISQTGTTVKDGLRGSRPLAIACVQLDPATDNVELTGTIDCDRPHTAELAGIFTPPEQTWPTSQEIRSLLGDAGCAQVIARFLGFPDATAGKNDAITSWWLSISGTTFDEQRWQLGDRSVLCFAQAAASLGQMVGSVHGIRTGTPQHS